MKKKEAAIMLDDEEVEFVQIRRRPNAESVCMCSLYAGRDKYGLGKGVPEARCAGAALSSVLQVQDGPRTDLTGRKSARRTRRQTAISCARSGNRWPSASRAAGQAGARAAIRRCDRGLQRRHPGGVSGQGAGAGGVTGYRAESSVD